MELEDYISKYIDSDLTEGEDSELRKILSEDEFSREKFDSAVNVHLAIKEDADSINVPEDLARQTEDIILMKILASKPIVFERSYFWRRSQVLAAMIIFFIFSFIFQINDLKINSLGGRGGLGNSSENRKNGVELAQASSPNSTAISDTRSITNNEFSAKSERIVNNNTNTLTNGHSNSDLAGGASIPSNEINTMDMSPVEFNSEVKDKAVLPGANTINPSVPVAVNKPSLNLSETEKIITDQTKNDKSNSLVVKSEKEVKDQSTEQEPLLLRKENKKPNSIIQAKPRMDENAVALTNAIPSEKNTEVIFSSFLGTDFIRSGLGNEEQLAVTNFSQSVGYSVNDNEKLGIEIGYSEYAYKEHITIPSPSLPTRKNVPIIETSELMIPIGSDFIEYSVTLDRQRHMVWGSAFYERSIVKSQDLSLQGRLGFGMSHDGPLGYGRIFGNYEFINGFSVNVGAEGRFFQATLPGETTGKRLRSTGTVIYGVQIDF